MTPAEFEIAAKTVWAESRGEPFDGQVAVAWVILNRARDPGPDWWGDSIIAVCHKPFQFSCWNPGDPNRARLDALGFADPNYRVACAAVLLAEAGVSRDPTNGATHYHTVARPSWLAADKPWPPAWAATMRATGVIGAHRFYKSAA